MSKSILIEKLSDRVSLVRLETTGGPSYGISWSNDKGHSGTKWFTSLETAKREAEKDFL